VGHLVAAPDKFRGTASASEVAAAAAEAARHGGWTADEVPLSDGGEGLLEAVGGEPRVTEVRGPLATSVAAEWRLVPALPDGSGPVAVVEMATAAGLLLAGGAERNDPLGASTFGVGELVLAGVAAGARRVIVGCGGSATTDGGLGAVSAIGSKDRLSGAELVVATDVTTRFERAAELFGPQKGATPEQVVALTARLGDVAEHYERAFGVDVRDVPGAGAAGGLAGGLVALGGRVVPGFDLVAGLVDLPARLARADLVVTGEGRLDPTSLEGKVVGSVIRLVAGRVPVLCIVGDVDPAVVDDEQLGPGVEVVSLVDLAGPERARAAVAELVRTVVAERLPR